MKFNILNLKIGTKIKIFDKEVLYTKAKKDQRIREVDIYYSKHPEILGATLTIKCKQRDEGFIMCHFRNKDYYIHSKEVEKISTQKVDVRDIYERY